jgi:hypothetical protein
MELAPSLRNSAPSLSCVEHINRAGSLLRIRKIKIRKIKIRKIKIRKMRKLKIRIRKIKIRITKIKIMMRKNHLYFYGNMWV